jgi:hypothetical protein
VKIVNKLFTIYATEEEVEKPAREDSIKKTEKGKNGIRLGYRKYGRIKNGEHCVIRWPTLNVTFMNMMKHRIDLVTPKPASFEAFRIDAQICSFSSSMNRAGTIPVSSILLIGSRNPEKRTNSY